MLEPLIYLPKLHSRIMTLTVIQSLLPHCFLNCWYRPFHPPKNVSLPICLLCFIPRAQDSSQHYHERKRETEIQWLMTYFYLGSTCAGCYCNPGLLARISGQLFNATAVSRDSVRKLCCFYLFYESLNWLESLFFICFYSCPKSSKIVVQCRLWLSW